MQSQQLCIFELYYLHCSLDAVYTLGVETIVKSWVSIILEKIQVQHNWVLITTFFLLSIRLFYVVGVKKKTIADDKIT